MFSDTVVILAAGRGSRMNCETPKVLLPIAGKPLIQYVIDFWLKEGAKQFIFVVGYQSEKVMDDITKISKYADYEYKFRIQLHQKGIADAIMHIKEDVREKFIVALGDCLNIGMLEYPDNLELGYGILGNSYQDHFKAGCSVSVDWKGNITSLNEKPCVSYPGIGAYFLDRRVFHFIHIASPSPLRNEIEITDVLASMVKSGLQIKAVPFYGEYLNINNPEDIRKAEKAFSNEVCVEY